MSVVERLIDGIALDPQVTCDLLRAQASQVAELQHLSLAFGEVDWWFRQTAQPVPRVLGLAERMRPAGGLPSGTGDPEGAPQVAIDAQGAAMHQRVIISSDGSAARTAVGDEKSPVRWMVVGVVDEKDSI